MELHQRLLLKLALRLRHGVLLCLAGIATAGAAAAPVSMAELARLASQGARVSAAVIDLDSGQTIAQVSAGTRLIPASLSKIVISAAALEAWPPDHHFSTELRAATLPADGVLSGNLVLRGSGDATLDETTLWGLAAQLRASGLRRVRGDVLVERAPFGELGCDTVDRCAGLRRSSRAYNAAPSAIGVNYGSWCIRARATAASSRAQVGGCASGDLPIPLSGTVQVASGGAALRVERITDEAGERIAVSGSIPAGSERSVHRAMSDPAAGTGLLLRSILMQSGIVVDGGVETTIRALPAPGHLLAQVDGLPLQEQIGRMMRYSNNYIADVLTMNLGLLRQDAAPASLAEASRHLGDYVRLAAGSTGEAPVMESGSGLTTGNRLSAQDLVHVLRRQYHDSRRFPAFYGSFVVPRDAPFSYLRSGGQGWLDRVALKTGSLSEPVSVQGLAGYLRKRNGGWMAFAILVNGAAPRAQIPQEEAMRAARADLERVLASW